MGNQFGNVIFPEKEDNINVLENLISNRLVEPEKLRVRDGSLT